MGRRKSSIIAEQKFLKRIEELGGIIIGEYGGSKTKVECICRNGHKCYPTPNHILQGQGVCKICAGNNSATAEKQFREKISQLGGRLIGDIRAAVFL